MGFDFSGYVLRAPRVAPVNAKTTAEPTTGVVRDIRPVPSVYSLQPTSPDGAPPAFVDAAADQYRAAVLEGPGTSTTEYLLWAQNTSQLALVDDPSWWTSMGDGAIPDGSLAVSGDFFDGSDRAVVTDQGNRSLGIIYRLVVARGDVDYDDDGWGDPDDPITSTRDGDLPYLVFDIAPANQTASAGIARLTAGQLATLDGGLSEDRGDRIVEVIYTVSPARFWWTRNDRYEKRFGWNGQKQRWEPYKGGPPQDLGPLAFDTTYQLTPRFANLPINAYLPGNAFTPDAYAMIRLGTTPGATSLPVAPDGTFSGVRVKADADVEGFDFSTDPMVSAVVGQTNGLLVFNPSYVQLNAGQTIWYSYQGFVADATGIVGDLYHADVNPRFISPIPGPSDYPFITLGSRRPLLVTLAESDAAADSLPPPQEGTVIVSLSTGWLRLSSADIAKSDPKSTFFDKQFLGAAVIYNGIALNHIPQPTRASTALLDDAGVPVLVTLGNKLYIPNATYLPDTIFGSDPWRGLGRSGILDAPDGTGAIPAQPTVPASVRPGGDTVGDTTTGRIRQVTDGTGDAFLFHWRGALQNIVTVDTEDDLPSSTSIPVGTAYICKEAVGLSSGVWGSRVEISRDDRKLVYGKYLYFSQATVTPANYTTKAQLLSKIRKIFRFAGTETLHIAIDGVYSVWSSSPLVLSNPTLSFFTADQVAASINSVLNAGKARALNERVLLESLTSGGSVEIGFGTDGEKDLSGAAVLGFLPGWRAVDGIVNWLPDCGASFGVFRSPVNLNRSNATADFNAVARLEDVVLQEEVSPNPFVFLDNVPLQDIAGYDEDVFFNFSNVITEGEAVQITSRPLEHFEDIVNHFEERKFNWVENNTVTGVVQQPVTTLPLERSSIVSESLLGAPGIGGGLYSAPEGGSFSLLDPETDYVLPQDGLTGEAILIERFGNLSSYGSLGTFTEGSTVFNDPSAQFVAGDNPVQDGYRLKLSTGDARGSYTVKSVTDDNNLIVEPAFLFSSERPMPWEVYKGYTADQYDPALVADAVYQEFDHLSSEPFKIRVLTPLGTTPVSETPRLRIPSTEAMLTSGRPISIRFKLEEATTENTASLVELAQSQLGTIANNALILSDNARVDAGAFKLRIGSTSVPQTSPPITLTGVTTFSPDPGDGVEYLTQDAVIDGESVPKGSVKFGSPLLSTYAGSVVWYVELFQAASAVTTGTVEFDTLTGDLNFSQADMTAHEGEEVYLVEQMITEERKDVAIAPTIGSVTFNTPIQTGQTVEMDYFQATTDGRKLGDQITEFLPVFVQNEVAVKQTTPSNVYLFNSALRTVDQTIEPIVYIGPMQQNFGGVPDYVLEYPEHLNGQGQLTFSRGIADYIEITVSYAVYEALGGESSYETSTKPVYRPPFYITAAQDQFGLRGNRVAEFQVGQMLRVGSDCFYVRGTKYYPPRIDDGHAAGDITAVLIFPSTTREVGSRSPGNDSISVITGIPITTVVDPDGTTPVPTTAPAGFMQTIDLGDFPFEPVTKGQTKITFHGNLTRFAVPGHIIEIGGYPLTIIQVDINEDGSRTKITVASPFNAGFITGGQPTVKLSVRPVYPPSSRDFLGVGPFLGTEPVDLILFGETTSTGLEKPGRSLIPDIEYNIDPDSGLIKLIDPGQAALGGTQRLLLAFTRRRIMQPFYQDGALLFPRYHADYLYTTIPSAQNGLEGGQLTATYTFSHPDAFYFRAVPMPQFIGEAAQEAQKEITSKQPAGGPVVTTSGGTLNWQQGNIGLLGERRHLADKDRAARSFLSFYNTTVIGFEQVLETISGGLIGDRDGKFRFWVGRGKDYTPPGYEDTITGLLNPRLLWNQVFQEARAPLTSIWVLESDHIVEPSTATLDNKVLEGSFPNPYHLDKLMQRQKWIAANDVDDRLLTGISDTQFHWFFYFTATGRYQRMADPHRFSRLFPQRTKAFFFTYPGVGADTDSGDPGVYTWGRMFGDENAQTYGKPIGQLQNPVLGNIEQVSKAILSDRLPRARIWGYFPDGIPQSVVDNWVAAGAFPGGATSITGPCLVATPLMLRDLPIDPETGYPDISQFFDAYPEGSIASLTSGDPSMAIPKFEGGQQVAWGQPDGKTYQAFISRLIDVHGTLGLVGVFIRDVQYGCVIRFQDDLGNPVTSPLNLLVGTAPDEGIPAQYFPIEQGDTIYVGPPGGVSTAPTDPPDAATLAELVKVLPGYREGYDLDVISNGQIIDKTWPSWYDPFFLGIKEILGQNPPKPLYPLEGPVDFAYTAQNPLEIPALTGGEFDDSGDQRIPYLKTGLTELDRFDEVDVSAAGILAALNAAGTLFIYPDEVSAHDGETVDQVTPWGVAEKEPGTLITAQDVEPKTLAHPLADEPGIGNVGGHDLLLVQVDDLGTHIPVGAQGILSVGAAESRKLDTNVYGSIIEPPRFITQTTPALGPTNQTGSPIRYVLENAQVFLNPPYPPDPQVAPPDGVYITEDSGTGLTYLDFSSLDITLNDGFTLGTGNLNDIWAASATNRITIEILARADPNIAIPAPSPGGGTVVLKLDIQGLNLTVTDYAGAVTGPFIMTAPPVFGTHFGATNPQVDLNRQIHLAIVGAIPLNAPAGLESTWIIPYNASVPGVKSTLYGFEFSVSVDTHTDAAAKSDTAYVADDRLSFVEVLDLQLAKKRGTTHSVSGLDLETSLVVHEVTCAGQFSTINASSNGGPTPVPFTFVQRSTAIGPEDAGGTWTNRPNAATPEKGTLKVPAMEAWGNVPIEVGGQPLSGVRFAAVPSCPDEEDGSTILQGTGVTASQYSGITGAAEYDNRIRSITTTAGAISNVLPGDIAIIKEANAGADLATTKAGTYLVRYAAAATPGQQYFEASAGDTTAGVGEDGDYFDGEWRHGGWLPEKFPKVISYTDTSATTANLVVGLEWTAFTWGASRLYIVISSPGLLGSVLADYREGALSVDFTAVTVGAETVSIAIDTTTFRYADNTTATAAQATALIEPDMMVSGMTEMPVSVRGGAFPDDPSVSGYQDAAASLGFTALTMAVPLRASAAFDITGITAGGAATLTSTNPTFEPWMTGYYIRISGADVADQDGEFGPITWVSATQVTYANPAAPALPATAGTFLLVWPQLTAAAGEIEASAAPAAGHLGVQAPAPVPVPPYIFPAADDPIYENVPRTMYLNLEAPLWETLNNPHRFGPTGAVNDITATVGPDTVVLTSTTAVFLPWMTGLSITVAGATVAGQNGLFGPITYLNPTQIRYDNSGAFPAETGPSPATWQLGAGVQCILPWTDLSLTFRVQAGFFLEPSFPRSTTNLGAAQPHVVDAGHSLPNPAPLPDREREIGMRDYNSYLGTGAVARTTPEPVKFEVRRIRRFHEVNDILHGSLRPLQYAYEIRRGRISAPPVMDIKQFCEVTALSFVMDWETTKPVGAPKAPDVWNDGSENTGTNLGDFEDKDVGINPGDRFRVLDENGDLFEEGEVVSVVSESKVLLTPPGLSNHTNPADYVGMRFEVFLRQAPVPHEQSCEQLLDLITSRRVTRTFADYTTDKGGYVPEILTGQAFGDVANRLYDDLNADGSSGKTFSALGVRRDDIVLIDPAGRIPLDGGLPSPQERGIRPFGDLGIVDRGAAYTAGGPSIYDDNRGFYRVTAVVDNQGTPRLEVTGVSTFAGAANTPIVFPEDTATRAVFGYTVYPTIHESALNQPPYVTPDPGVGNRVEGQADLRPTKARDATTKSFEGNSYSLRPFSYTIIRPSSLFSDEAVDLALTMRERMLSLIELFRGPMRGRRNGAYYIFQRDEHIDELCDPTDSELGLGVFSNLIVQNIVGRLGVTPFSNFSDGLSLLDRRFWVLDRRLDSLTSAGDGVSMKKVVPGDTPYTAYTDTTGGGASVLPVLPDRVNLVLDQTDKFRPLRYVWLAYRVHRLLGTLAAIERFDTELPERLAQQEALLLLEDSMSKVET